MKAKFIFPRNVFVPVGHFKHIGSRFCVHSKSGATLQPPATSWSLTLLKPSGSDRLECIDGGLEEPVQMSHRRRSDAASVSSVPRNASTGSPECGQTFRSGDSSGSSRGFRPSGQGSPAENSGPGPNHSPAFSLFFLLLVQQIFKSLGHEAFKAFLKILKGFHLAQSQRRRD